MKIIDWNDLLKPENYISRSCAATLGVFDGVHKGHQYILNYLKDENCTERVVFTFKKNPAILFAPKNYIGNIYTLQQKLDSLEKSGVTTTVLIDFSRDFSKLTGRYFISCIEKAINLVKFVAGDDFKCGNISDVTALNLQDYLNSSKKVNLFFSERIALEGIPVSSTAIRKLITEGKIQEADKLLEYGYKLDLRGHKAFDSSNIKKNSIEQVLPYEGKYKIPVITDNNTLIRDIIIDKDFFKLV